LDLLTNNPFTDREPPWSPDGVSIAALSLQDGGSETYVMNADGSGQVNISSNRSYDRDPSWGR
jgi:TolB protein